MVVIGVDIGGTSIKGGGVRQNGQVLGTFSFPFYKEDSAEKTMLRLSEEIKNYISSLEDPKEVVGVGIGCPGSIDSVNGVVSYSANLNWTEVPLKSFLEKELKLPVKITNDANAATLGEAKMGAGKMYKNLIMLTLGTGVGGGIIINGQLYEGNQGKGAEVGHMIIEVDGEQCACGRRGCFERYASATGLINITKKELENNKDTVMHKLLIEKYNGNVDGRLPFEAFSLNDAGGIKVIETYVKYLSEGILNFCNIFRPEAIILSGGVANAGEVLFNKIREYIKKENYGYKGTPAVDIVPSVLGYDSGKIGAACLFY